MSLEPIPEIVLIAVAALTAVPLAICIYTDKNL